jgi:hypothetical protein
MMNKEKRAETYLKTITTLRKERGYAELTAYKSRQEFMLVNPDLKAS